MCVRVEWLLTDASGVSAYVAKCLKHVSVCLCVSPFCLCCALPVSGDPSLFTIFVWVCPCLWYTALHASLCRLSCQSQLLDKLLLDSTDVLTAIPIAPCHSPYPPHRQANRFKKVKEKVRERAKKCLRNAFKVTAQLKRPETVLNNASQPKLPNTAHISRFTVEKAQTNRQRR